jgi:hypothetical protein
MLKVLKEKLLKKLYTQTARANHPMSGQKNWARMDVGARLPVIPENTKGKG